jgi:hypothetical protein
LIDFTSIDYTTSAFPLEAEDSTKNVATFVPGTINLARALTGGTAPISGDRLVAKVTFRTKTTGGAVNLTFANGTALVSSTTNTNLLSGAASYGNAIYTIDTVGPTVSISTPAANATINYGSTNTVSVSAPDATSSVSKVELLVNGALSATLTSSPYNFSWNTTGLAEGTYTLTAKAYDTFNNVSTSSATTVTIKDATAPTVSITAPANGATNLAGTVSVNANAADNSGGKGLSKVEFYVDGALKSTDTTSPYSYAWDTKTATDGSHTLSAKAFDNATVPNSTTSANFTVSVDNSDRVAPSAPLNLRSTSATFTGISLAWNASTDNVGVTGYQLTRNGAVIYSGTSLSYNDTSLASGTTYAYSVTAVDVSGNRSTATNASLATLQLKTGDINQDNAINAFDLSLLLSKWNTSDSTADINKDNTINAFDLSILLSNWGK